MDNVDLEVKIYNVFFHSGSGMFELRVEAEGETSAEAARNARGMLRGLVQRPNDWVVDRVEFADQ